MLFRGAACGVLSADEAVVDRHTDTQGGKRFSNTPGLTICFFLALAFPACRSSCRKCDDSLITVVPTIMRVKRRAFPPLQVMPAITFPFPCCLRCRSLLTLSRQKKPIDYVLLIPVFAHPATPISGPRSHLFPLGIITTNFLFRNPGLGQRKTRKPRARRRGFPLRPLDIRS